MNLLTLLKKGGKVVFPSGYILQGDPSNGYIDTGYEFCDEYNSDGLRILDRDGLRLALNDEKKYAKGLEQMAKENFRLK